MWWVLLYCVWVVLYYHLLYDRSRGATYTPYRRTVSRAAVLSPIAFLMFCTVHVMRVCWYVGGFVLYGLKAVGLAFIMFVQIAGDVVGREVEIGTEQGKGMKDFPHEWLKESVVMFEPDMMLGDEYENVYKYFNIIGVFAIFVALVMLASYMEGL